MKRKIGLILTILALSLLIFTLSISAIEYDDFTKNGTNGEAPIFVFIGYAIDEVNNSICVEYNINRDALDAYEAANNKEIKFGVVASAAERFANGAPLDPKTALPVDEKIHTIFVHNNKESSRISIRLTNIPEEYMDEEICLCLFIFDNGNVKYISGESSESAPEKVTYEQYAGPSEIQIANGVVFSTEKPENTMAWDRERQMGISASEYGTPVIDANTYTSSKLSSVLSGAKTIAGNGILGMIVKGIYPNASRFMAHYLKNTGADMTVDMGTGSSGFFKSGAGTITHRTERVNQALRAAEALAKEGKSISIYQQTEIVNHFGGTEDWYLAVGSYFTCIEMHELTVKVNADGTKTYSAKLKYSMADFYNWNENNWSTIPVVDVSQRDLHQLHRTKQAKEFETTGSITYSISWTEGQDASSLSYK